MGMHPCMHVCVGRGGWWVVGGALGEMVYFIPLGPVFLSLGMDGCWNWCYRSSFYCLWEGLGI